MVSKCHQCGADTQHTCAKCRFPVCTVCAEHGAGVEPEFERGELSALSFVRITICKDDCRPVKSFSR